MDENTKNVSTENAENPTPETKAETKPSEQNPDAETLAKYKRLLDKANSEAADYKRQLRAKMSDDERKAIEVEESRKAMEAELAEYKKRDTINNYKLGFMKAGFDEATATKNAEAVANGDFDTMFANLATLSDSISKSAVAKAMDAQKGLSVGSVPSSADVDKANQAALRRAFGLR